MSKILTEIIYNLPIFDDTNLGLPCLEELSKEIGVNYSALAEQEDIAEMIIKRLLAFKKLTCISGLVMDWWNKHKDDTAPFDYDDSYNIYEETPKFVRIAQQTIKETEGNYE